MHKVMLDGKFIVVSNALEYTTIVCSNRLRAVRMYHVLAGRLDRYGLLDNESGIIA